MSAQIIVLPRPFFSAAGRLKLLALCAATGRELVSTRRGNVALVERVTQPRSAADLARRRALTDGL